MKKALIIGIDHYNSKISNLKSCASSAQTISKLLERNEVAGNTKGERNFDCKLLTSSNENELEKVTRKSLKENCKALFEDDEADVALFYFSGYGFDDQLGGYLVTQDTEEHDDGFALSDLMIYANNSSIKEINIILDCHFSKHTPKLAETDGQFAVLRKGISILSVKNKENTKTNLFSELITTALKGGNRNLLGNITFIDLYEQTVNILSGLGYEINFRVNTSRLTVLRKIPSKIPYEILMKITHYFHSSHYKYPLDKEHIPSLKLGNDAKQIDYKNLQKMHKQGLVKPVNAFHFYYAAFNEKHCALTELGKQYWELLKKKRI